MATELCLAQYFVDFGGSVTWAADEGKRGRQNVSDLPCQAVKVWAEGPLQPELVSV